MTVVSTQTPLVETSPSGFSTLFNFLKDRWTKGRMIRQTRQELSRLSDRELADLGLDRLMIERTVHDLIDRKTTF